MGTSWWQGRWWFKNVGEISEYLINLGVYGLWLGVD